MGNPPRDSCRAVGKTECDLTDVLVVDDNAAFRRALRCVIEAAGYLLVGEAETGEEGLDMARSTKPQLILMDVHMPGITGIVAALQIIEHQPDVVVLLMTVTVDETVGAELLASGLEWVRKDQITPDTLPTLIAAAQGEAGGR